ncbi:hypothetical protein [Listeria grayi]|uniref:hypothetical protein n=1 Tax=Listeria grayi TaxID=1641 RepID=UPI0015589C30|nr:hypothetical protein [Listeria grayi]
MVGRIRTSQEKIPNNESSGHDGDESKSGYDVSVNEQLAEAEKSLKHLIEFDFYD